MHATPLYAAVRETRRLALANLAARPPRPLAALHPHPGEQPVAQLLLDTDHARLSAACWADELYHHTAGWVSHLAVGLSGSLSLADEGMGTELLPRSLLLVQGAALALYLAYGSLSALVGARSALTWAAQIPRDGHGDEQLAWAVAELRRSMVTLGSSPNMA